MNWNEVLEPLATNKDQLVSEQSITPAYTDLEQTEIRIKQKVASEQVMQDLINTLLAEGFWSNDQLQLLSTEQLNQKVISTLTDQHKSQKEDILSVLSSITDTSLLQNSLWYYWEIPALSLEPSALSDSSQRIDQPQYTVIFPVQSAIVQPYRYVPASVTIYSYKQQATARHASLSAKELTDTHVYAIRYSTTCTTDHNAPLLQITPLTPVQLMKIVNDQCLTATYREQPGVKRFVQLLEETIKQTTWSLDHSLSEESWFDRSASDFFQQMERYASLRDRPFHPVSKAKVGLDKQDYRQYSAEFAQPILLSWIAIKRNLVMEGEALLDRIVLDYQLYDYRQDSTLACDLSEPMTDLLSLDQQQQVIQAIEDKGLNTNEYIAIPVHPWQLQHNLPHYLRTAQAQGDWIDLQLQLGLFEATSSVRSLSPVNDSPHYIKLPLSVFSLGASRYLPAVKLINGQRGQRMLEQALKCDPILAQQLFLCDERRWWAYMPQAGSLFDDEPRHLAAMVRTYPASLITGEKGTRLLPMSALSVVLPVSTNAPREGHFFDEWMKVRDLDVNQESICILFGEVCQTFFQINLRLFRLGLMPELHGQNSVLVWQHGYMKQMLLRDHDSVRLHLPWLQQQGIDDPQYMIRPGYSNSLYNDTPEELIFYLQTLGIQVNLYAIIDALSTVYDIEEKLLWNILRDQLREQLHEVPFAAEVRQAIYSILFEKEEWPLKLVVKPLLEQAGVPGSMPSGQSTIQNPFLQL